jgi:hypothetical protein
MIKQKQIVRNNILNIAILDTMIEVLKDLKKEKERELKELNEVMKK